MSLGSGFRPICKPEVLGAAQDDIAPKAGSEAASVDLQAAWCIIPIAHNKCACLSHFERSKAESRNLFE